MQWTVEFSKVAASHLKSLDKPIRNQIQKFIQRLENHANPRLLGKPLVGEFRGLWRYRVGDYRLICEFFDDRLVVFVLELDHRSRIYR
ncbi:MAG: hypothetical protein RIT27_96 [Pseudomonadota bacterium]|jgi:mRNA interferase RelE/StbE